MIREYLNEVTYKYVIHKEYVNNGLKHVLVEEFEPSGQSGGSYVLFEKDGHVYNEEGEPCT